MNRHPIKPVSRWQRAMALVMILTVETSGLAQAADLSQQMASMFSNGSLANVTGPGAYKSQTQSIYMGGEMQLRFPSRSYQLWSLSLPSVRAGCGGVDAYLGSFSHISSDQMRQMLEQVAQAYAALLFKAALKSINPLIESVIGDLQKTLEAYSNNSRSVCAMAQAAVDATSSVTGMSAQETCVTAAMQIFSDSEPDARKRCKADLAETNNIAKSSGDPAVRALADRDVNLIWDSLSRSSFSREEKELFMNIAGTVIIRKPANDAASAPTIPTPYEPSIDSLNTLLNGHQQGASADQVVINTWLSCPDADCLQPTSGPSTVTPFPTLVRRMLETIRDRVINREALQPAELQFVNMTTVPVYRLVTMGYMSGSASGGQFDLVDVLINRYAKVIAYDYAFSFMRVALKDARVYLNLADVKTKTEQAQRDRMVDNVNRLMEEIDREHSKALARVREVRSVVDDMQAIEREMRLSLPTSIRNMQDISNLLKGGRT